VDNNEKSLMIRGNDMTFIEHHRIQDVEGKHAKKRPNHEQW